MTSFSFPRRDYRITWYRGIRYVTYVTSNGWRAGRRTGYISTPDGAHIPAAYLTATAGLDWFDPWHGKPTIASDDDIREAARSIAGSITEDARNSGDDPVVWVTGNSYMPPMRSFSAAETIWDDPRNGDGEKFAWLTELVETMLDEAGVYLGCPDYDNALYAVDLRRFEFRDDDGNGDDDGDDGWDLQSEWKPRPHPPEGYAEEAVYHAAAALLWQASDATENGNGFPIGDDDNGTMHGETEFIEQVIDQVPYLTEAVSTFVRGSWLLLERAGVTAPQAGHDFILTANHHGAGFWDRGHDMPAYDDEAYAAWLDGRTMKRPGFYRAWLRKHRTAIASYPKTVGDALTEDCRGYSFDAEFALNEDGDVDWLMVDNTVLVDERDWSVSSES